MAMPVGKGCEHCVRCYANSGPSADPALAERLKSSGVLEALEALTRWQEKGGEMPPILKPLAERCDGWAEPIPAGAHEQRPSYGREPPVWPTREMEDWARGNRFSAGFSSPLQGARAIGAHLNVETAPPRYCRGEVRVEDPRAPGWVAWAPVPATLRAPVDAASCPAYRPVSSAYAAPAPPTWLERLVRRIPYRRAALGL